MPLWIRGGENKKSQLQNNNNTTNTNNKRRRRFLFCTYCLPLILISFLTLKRYPTIIDSYTIDKPLEEWVTKMDDVVTIPIIPKIYKSKGTEHFFLLPNNEGDDDNKEEEQKKKQKNNEEEEREGKKKKKKKQKKKDDTMKKEPSIKGILILFHSCKRSGSAFFHLPEERVIVYEALQRGWAVIAPTSKDRESGCWTQVDLATIDSDIDSWAKEYVVGLHDDDDDDDTDDVKNTDEKYTIPRIGLGDSSGASFMFFVYKSLKLKSMAIYNSPQTFHLDDIEKNLVIPTAFVTMTADDNLSTQISINYDKIQSIGVPTQLYTVSPHPFTSGVCIARFPELEQNDCDKIFDTIQRDFSFLLDRHYFVVNSNINNSKNKGNKNKSNKRKKKKKENSNTIMGPDQWNNFFSKIDIDYDSALSHYMKDESRPGHSLINDGIKQELKTCQGFHAFTSENYAIILDFLMKEATTTSGLPS